MAVRRWQLPGRSGHPLSVATPCMAPWPQPRGAFRLLADGSVQYRHAPRGDWRCGAELRAAAAKPAWDDSVACTRVRLSCMSALHHVHRTRCVQNGCTGIGHLAGPRLPLSLCLHCSEAPPVAGVCSACGAWHAGAGMSGCGLRWPAWPSAMHSAGRHAGQSLCAWAAETGLDKTACMLPRPAARLHRSGQVPCSWQCGYVKFSMWQTEADYVQAGSCTHCWHWNALNCLHSKSREGIMCGSRCKRAQFRVSSCPAQCSYTPESCVVCRMRAVSAGGM